MDNQYLALAYQDIDPHTADRLRSCATRLTYQVNPDHSRKLAAANFCRVRLCPICQWRRSLKLYAQMIQVMKYHAEHDPKAYVFLTLTVKNCSMDELSAKLDDISEAFKLFVQYKEFTDAIRGYYRGIEITHNLDRTSQDFDTFHPHVHVVLAVNPSYFTSRQYISQAKWTALWQRALGVNYTPIVDVRRIHGDSPQAVAEATKYSVKSKDYIVLDDWQLTIDTVRGLDAMLHKRRFVGFGGCFLQTRRILKQTNPDTGDLIHVDPNQKSTEKNTYFESYAWHSGYAQFVKESD